MSPWLTLIAALACAPYSRGAFEPGCSFMNQQCIYNVKLGHEGKCDAGSQQLTGSSAAECCSTVQGNVDGLHSVVNDLVKQLHDVQVHLGLSQNVSGQLKTTANERDQLLVDLARKEAELKSSQSNLASLVKQSADVIKAMKEELTNSTRDLNTCRGVLGLKTKPVPRTDTDNVDVHVCTFENGLCGYKVEGGDNSMWKLTQGTKRLNTGPQEDHTYGAPTGHYMLMDPLDGTLRGYGYNRTFTMTSPIFEPAHAYCVRFWYDMNGHDVRSLNLFAKIGNGKGNAIWNSYGNSGLHWHLAEINLDSEYTSQQFRLVFESSTNAYVDRYNNARDGKGEVALDDIYVYNVSCHSIASCPNGIRMGGNSTSCYTFHTTPETWYNSSLSCHDEGATSHLVSINSKDEQEFLARTIQQDAALSAAGSLGYYTSGNDERREGTFDWTDIGAPITGYSDWHAGQPNNVGSNQNCLLMQYADADYEWGDVYCAEKHPFICEVDSPVV